MKTKIIKIKDQKVQRILVEEVFFDSECCISSD
jgi:hypothetical protein